MNEEISNLAARPADAADGLGSLQLDLWRWRPIDVAVARAPFDSLDASRQAGHDVSAAPVG
jgi:hypothetical protein